ncbi:hypothetical protein BKA66DRAFT_298744 [Pyrenochaeta sp. MPI-SDFR-AT-0127]|nr:hypothetical protein BKA66DRAFT_298744 [Pyrenochaeta sp. MPI-SDFR-AT-0127]
MDVEQSYIESFKTKLQDSRLAFNETSCTTIEAVNYHGTVEPTFLKETRGDEDLKAWVNSEVPHDKGKPTSCLRLILCEHPLYSEVNDTSNAQQILAAQVARQVALQTLPIQKATFEHILEKWNLPKTLLKAIFKRSTNYTRPLKIGNVAQEVWTGCVVQFEVPDFSDLLLALSWNLATRTTYGIILGCKVSEVKRISRLLRYSTSSISHPLLTLAPFADVQLSRLHQAYLDGSAKYDQARSDTGLLGQGDASEKSIKDYKTLIIDIMNSFSKSGFLVTAVQRFQAQLEKVVLDLDIDKLTYGQIPVAHPTIDKRRLAEQLTETLDSVNDVIEKSRYQNNEASLLMSALWNLVAQQDNIISRSIAEESKTIALESKSISEQARLLTEKSVELGGETRNISAQAKVLAEESVKLSKESRNISKEAMKIADDTKRDSTSMVAIATLTMVFLPMSFVATFLGMPIFNWQAEIPKKIVKRSQILIYVYSALPLTLIVVFLWACWLFYSENRRKKTAADTEAAEQAAQIVNATPAAGTTKGADVSNITGTVADVG